MIQDSRREISDALARFATGTPLGTCATALLKTLGYHSDRTLETGSVEEFLNDLDAHEKLTQKQLGMFQPWQAVEIVFQFTGEEINQQQAGLFDINDFDDIQIESFLFLAAELSEGEYSRTQLAETTRAVNRLFNMPVIVVFRYSSYMTLAAIHRRRHKIDTT
ncbi:MAG: hypothetical protein F4Z15_00800 [Gammaproteobacteria bacterium]|nr:hypothetical protein [Gammaproteobacteria bacterium]MYD76428.1 hypothetical protein [Gammaproteobacteria bacterium]MYJ51391.1 hypothetical protein [Gammaproteobacteria bacterium]